MLTEHNHTKPTKPNPTKLNRQHFLEHSVNTIQPFFLLLLRHRLDLPIIALLLIRIFHLRTAMATPAH